MGPTFYKFEDRSLVLKITECVCVQKSAVDAVVYPPYTHLIANLPVAI